MSSLIGTPGDRWSLARAIDALGDAARQASTPGLVWVLGLFYPSLDLIAATGGAVLLSVLMNADVSELEGFEAVASLLVFQFLLVPRVSAGLALAGSAGAWADLRGERESPRLRDVWRLGRGLGWDTLGLWFQLLFVLVVHFVVLVLAPLSVLRHFGLDPQGSTLAVNVPITVVLGPFVTIFLACSFVLSVLYQLGLQSLVQNRRGVGSAMLHAWRIARNDPWATARAVMVDFLALIGAYPVWILALVAAGTLASAACCAAPVTLVLAIFRVEWVSRWHHVLYRLLMLACLGLGLIGIVRAAYWARVYRALGGLAPTDGVPGLASGMKTFGPAPQ